MADLVGFDDPEAQGPTERRHTMKSGQVKRTPLGDVKFRLVVDLPATFPEDYFKQLMGEYAAILGKTFPYEGTLKEQ